MHPQDIPNSEVDCDSLLIGAEYAHDVIDRVRNGGKAGKFDLLDAIDAAKNAEKSWRIGFAGTIARALREVGP